MSSAATLTFKDNIRLQNLKIVCFYIEYCWILLRLD